MEFTSVIERYVTAHSQPQDEVLAWLERETHYRTVHPRMLCGEPMGTFLTLWVQLMRPSRILEIGTFTGYSAICLARGLDANSRGLDTIEIFDEHQTLIQEAFARSGMAPRIRVHWGDALQVIPQLGPGPFPLVYMDGNKREYEAYYDLVKPLVPKGGYILADNVLWDGKVADDTQRDAQTLGIRAFNKKVQEDPDVTNVLLPLFDGLMIIQRN